MRAAQHILHEEQTKLAPLIDASDKLIRAFTPTTWIASAIFISVFAALNHRLIELNTFVYIFIAILVGWSCLGIIKSIPSFKMYRILRSTQKHLGLRRQPWISLASWSEIRARLPRMVPAVVGLAALPVYSLFSAYSGSRSLLLLDLAFAIQMIGVTWSVNMIAVRNSIPLVTLKEGNRHLQDIIREASSRQVREGSTAIPVILTDQEYISLARLERALAAYDRRVAIEGTDSRIDFVNAAALAQEPSALASRSLFDRRRRLLLQTALDQLVVDPAVRSATEGTQQKMSVSGADIEILFSVAHGGRRIHILDYVDLSVRRNPSETGFQSGPTE